MSRAAAIATVMAMTAAVFAAAPASADQRVICNPVTKRCRVVVERPEVGGGRGGGGKGGGGASARPIVESPPSLVDQCFLEVASPPPPPTDRVWAGRTPADGSVYIRTCPITKTGPVSSLVFVANGEPAPVTVTPLQLAQSAVATLKLPKPSIRRSPSAKSTVDGSPFTWVNAWTWYWTARSSWRTQSKRAQVGDVWAEVTVEPVELVFEPGDGSAASVCSGPGRPWRPPDEDRAPTSGGCAYKYESVTTAGPLTATLSIRWRVRWIGSGNVGDDLPAMTTSAETEFSVQQLQSVNR